jgi:hypothetical protein
MWFVNISIGFPSSWQFVVVAQLRSLREFCVRVWHWPMRVVGVRVGFPSSWQFNFRAQFCSIW